MHQVMTVPRVVLADNPLWPAAYDGLWSALIFIVSVFMIGALIDVMRTATFLRAAEWVVLIMLLPVLGPVIWFTFGRRRFVR